MTSEATRRLRTVSLLHTAVLATIVLGEVMVLWFNRWSCPLTAVAARYTEDRRANFDIYLRECLARHNQSIFGTLYVAGVVFLAVRWVGA
jgi:hypothetical protein